MKKSSLEPSLEQELRGIAEGAGCELLDVRFAGGVLRTVIDHADGVTVDHCKTVSKQVSALLDVADWGRGKYTLEVSSPGLDRELYTARDYQRFQGSQVKVTFHPVDGKRTVTGALEAFAPGDEERQGSEEITVRLSEDEVLDIPLDSIETTRLVPEF